MKRSPFKLPGLGNTVAKMVTRCFKNDKIQLVNVYFIVNKFTFKKYRLLMVTKRGYGKNQIAWLNGMNCN